MGDLFALALLVGQFVGWIILLGLIAWGVGWLVDLVLDRTIERYLDKTKVGKELREIGLDFSDSVGLFVAVLLFIYGLRSYLATMTEVSTTVPQLMTILDFALAVTIVLGFFTVGLLFVAFFSDYLARLVRAHDENVAEILKSILFVGLTWVVLYVGISIWGLQYNLINGLIAGFVVLAIGWFVISFFISRFEEGSFKEFAPYAKFFLFTLFVLISLTAMFAGYVTDAEIMRIFAWGVVALFVATALPFVIRAIKELY